MDCVRILLVDDDEDDYIIVRNLLSKIEMWTFELYWTATYEVAMEAIESGRHDVCLIDYRLGAHSGLELLRRMAERGCRTPMILLTGQGGQQVDMEAMKAGAADFLAKSQINATLLERAIRYAIERARNLHALRERGEVLQDLNAELQETNRKLKATQIHLVQSEKMASLGQLVAGIAHEINNPLGFVLSNVYAVERYMNRTANEVSSRLSSDAVQMQFKAQKLVGDMRSGLERVKDLVLKLRTFSRLDQEAFNTIDVHESIDSVLMFLRHKTKHRIRIDKVYGADGMLTCYSGKLNQVLMNVIANAVDAIEGHGVITIATAREDDVFVISVHDTGKGIPEAIQHRIFEPFFTTKPVGSGTGLGLSITHSIVQDHQGCITFDSVEGKGTTFTVRIPTDLQKDAPCLA